MPYSLYIHLPFCKSRCRYCDFYSGTAESVPDAYIEALLAAFAQYQILPARCAGDSGTDGERHLCTSAERVCEDAL